MNDKMDQDALLSVGVHWALQIPVEINLADWRKNLETFCTYLQY